MATMTLIKGQDMMPLNRNDINKLKQKIDNITLEQRLWAQISSDRINQQMRSVNDRTNNRGIPKQSGKSEYKKLKTKKNLR